MPRGMVMASNRNGGSRTLLLSSSSSFSSSSFFLLLVLHFAHTSSLEQQSAWAQPVPDHGKFPAIFIFGDSLTDSGNNNKLSTLARANRPPYGRDFTTHKPTGRFCNGPLSTDYIASLAGLPFPLPYLSAGDNVLKGVTFASASSGILNSTGSTFGQHIPLHEQVSFFSSVKQVLTSKLGTQQAQHIISRSLFYVSIGSNDYIEGYVAVPGAQSPLQLLYSPSEFVELLQCNLESSIVELYNMGARKIAVVGLSVLGCVPYELSIRRSNGGKCIESINQLTSGYNVALLARVQRLQATYTDAQFVYLNSYDLLNNVVQDPAAYGFSVADSACCGSGAYKGLIPCYANVTFLCRDASRYVFWDFVHPTATFNKLVANTFWAGTPPSVHPFNLQHLAAL